MILIIALISLSLRVIDGDTIVVGGEHIRLLDIDTPEIKGKCLSEKTKAYQAKGFVQGALAGQPIRIERHGKGKYGRTLAYIYVNDRNLSQMLLDAGLAREYGKGRKPWCKVVK